MSKSWGTQGTPVWRGRFHSRAVQNGTRMDILCEPSNVITCERPKLQHLTQRTSLEARGIGKQKESNNYLCRRLAPPLRLYVLNRINYVVITKHQIPLYCPGLCGSVDWVLAFEPTVTGLIPGQGTCLVWGARSPVGCMQEATNRCFSPSLSPSLPLSLKINK